MASLAIRGFPFSLEEKSNEKGNAANASKQLLLRQSMSFAPSLKSILRNTAESPFTLSPNQRSFPSPTPQIT